MGAVLIIALFYTSELSYWNLGAGLGVLSLLALANILGVRKPLVYLVLAIVAWVFFFHSGVHATVCGVLAAMTIPSRPRSGGVDFIARAKEILKEFQKARDEDGLGMLESKRQPLLLMTLREACRDAETPLQRLDAMLHPWVAFGIMPIFALVNAGVLLPQDMLSAIAQPLNLGIMLGLVLGKPIGVVLTSTMLVGLGLVPKLHAVTWRHMIGVGCLAGIGFTMSIFITELAFTDLASKDSAKLGILCGSLVSAITGWLILRSAAPAKTV